jgi:hypothetical protein
MLGIESIAFQDGMMQIKKSLLVFDDNVSVNGIVILPINSEF